MSSTTVSIGKVGVENRTPASAQKYARFAGALYLLIFFVGPFAFFMGRVGVVVPGDPTANGGEFDGLSVGVPAGYCGRNGYRLG